MSYETIATLMKGSPQSWTADAVLDGGFGDVLFDDGDAAALRMGNFFLVEGPVSTERVRRIADALPRPAYITSSDDTWYRAIQDVVGDGEVVTRRFFEWRDRGAYHRFADGPLPDGMTIVPIDATLFDAIRSCAWADDVFDPYDGADDFGRRGFGFCILLGRAPVSVCLSVCGTDRAVEVEIDTAPVHQGKGLAKVVAAAFLDECESRGVTPLWDASNEASARLAAALGFREASVYETLFLA